MRKSTGENRIIELLQNRYSPVNRLLKKGIGDDAAVVRPGRAEEYWLITTDMLVEGVDFQRSWASPACLGFKSLAVNLSDLAAMGARPRFFAVSLALPSDLSLERWTLQFYDGMTGLADSQGALLVGGDLSRSQSGITISIAAVGESIHRRVIYRSGGRAGDRLYVTGVLGKSAAGLKLLKEGHVHPRKAPEKEAIRAHQRPEPRGTTGVWLAQSGLVRCMMDISDGLSTDLARLCRASDVGAEIDGAAVPVFRESSLWNCDPLALALHGGEDFELLFAVPPSKVGTLERTYPATFPPISRIGRFTRDRRMTITGPGNRQHTLSQKGYDHFQVVSRQ